MRYGDKLDDIIEAAVARGDAPGVVAAVGRGDEGYLADGAGGLVSTAGTCSGSAGCCCCPGVTRC